MAMRLIFMGTPDFAAHPLQALIDAGYEIAAVYTRPPQRAGRGMQMRLSPVHEIAQAQGLTVETPRSLRDPDALAQFKTYHADLAIVAAYGLILPASILNTPRLGCWNIHASLLPRWRGAAPIQRAIMAGDPYTGISIMQMDEGLDTGPVWLDAKIAIDATDDAQTLHDRLMALGTATCLQALDALEKGALPTAPQPQEEALASYAAKIDKAEAKIDWDQSADHLARLIRGVSPFPGAWCMMAGERVKILSAEYDLARQGSAGQLLDGDGWIGCGTGALKLTRVQRAGKGAMDFAAYLRGQDLVVGHDIASENGSK